MCRSSTDCGVSLGRVAFGDDALRITGPVGESLQPPGLVDRIRNAERSLDVDRLRDIGEADLGDIIVNPVVLGLQCVDVAEKRMDRVGLEPGIAELRPLEIVQVKMGVDQRYVGHAALAHRAAKTTGCGGKPSLLSRANEPRGKIH